MSAVRGAPAVECRATFQVTGAWRRPDHANERGSPVPGQATFRVAGTCGQRPRWRRSATTGGGRQATEPAGERKIIRLTCRGGTEAHSPRESAVRSTPRRSRSPRDEPSAVVRLTRAYRRRPPSLPPGTEVAHGPAVLPRGEAGESAAKARAGRAGGVHEPSALASGLFRWSDRLGANRGWSRWWRRAARAVTPSARVRAVAGRATVVAFWARSWAPCRTGVAPSCSGCGS